jgi:glycosyltransferase involved in cell wall biosynthesis
MRILYVLPFVPTITRVRCLNLIPRLARNHTIDLVCLASAKDDFSKVEEISSYCNSVRYIFHSRVKGVFQAAKALPTSLPLRIAYTSSAGMEALVRSTSQANRPDLIYVERWRALQYVPQDCGVPVLCDPTDSMILYNRRLSSTGSWWERIIGAVEHARFLKYEPVLARRADVTIFCSTLDRDCLLAQDFDANTEIIPNGVDCDRFFRKDEGQTEAATLIFTGNFGYRPNVHAVRYFIRKVLPHIRQKCSGVKFMAVGKCAARKLRKYVAGTEGFEAVDLVPDLRPYLARATVSVAPLTVGAGVSNKVLEAFAVGTPVVATSLACGDLPVRDGEHLYLADTPEIFAARVLDLLQDPLARRRMTDKGRALAEAKYDWEIVARRLEALMCRLIENRKRGMEQFAVPGTT